MQNAPAAERNRGPILEVLLKHLGSDFRGNVLEIASGTGQHVTHFAQTFTGATFQPSDVDDISSISAYKETFNLTNVLPPVLINVTKPCGDWPGDHQNGKYDVIYNSNMVHISPWDTAIGLFDAAGKLLKPGGYLITYGPYAENGVIVADSNVRFNQSLRMRDPSWGIRDIKDLSVLGDAVGIKLIDKVDMPANNKTLIWKKNDALP